MSDAQDNLLAVAVGNSNVSFGFFEGATLLRSGRVRTADADAPAAVVDLAATHAARLAVVASVNDPALPPFLDALREAGVQTLRIGRDLPLNIRHTLDDASTVGQDRILCTIAAFRTLGQACIVVDAGTAVTVDFIDGEGTFHGGAIAPGLAMMLRALHEHTASLPDVSPNRDPAAATFGTDTPSAMLLGVHAAVRGMVYHLIDRYAQAYGAYPTVVATGGDARRLFADDGIVDRIVPDLQLHGIRAVCTLAAMDADLRKHDP